MSDLIQNELVAVYVVIIASIVLILVTIYLFVSSLIVRYTHNRREQFYHRKREECLPNILEFVFESDNPDISKIENSLKSEKDFTPVLSLIFELLDDVEGNETNQLRSILGIKKIRAYHLNLLKKGNRDEKIQACIYYAKLADFTQDETKLLTGLITNPSLLVAHSAATAIMANEDPKVRYLALASIAKRKRVSKLAILELLYLFHNTENDQMDAEAHLLIGLILDKDVPDDHVGIIVKGITDIGYITMSDNLFEILQHEIVNDRELVLESLIYAIGRLQFGLAADWILKRYKSDPRPRIRRACAAMIDYLGDPDFAEVLFQLASDEEFSVRIKSIYALAGLGLQGKSYLNKLSEQTTELRTMIRSIVGEMEQGSV